MTTTRSETGIDATTTRTRAMVDGRHAETLRRRRRVLAALDNAVSEGAQVGVSTIARAAGVDRSFLYRHRDLLEKIHAAETEPTGISQGSSSAVTRASLQADLLAAHDRANRLHTRIQQLETRLSETLGAQVWQESGLNAPANTDALRQQIVHLEEQAADLRLQLQERDQDLAAARAANRELMAQINAPGGR